MMEPQPPKLETTRLVLRGLEEGDLDSYAAMTGDPEVMRHIGAGQVLDRAQAWREIATHIGHWQLRGYGQWALERREDGRLIGRAGLWNPAGWPGLEVGWMLARDVWGSGYATEAGEAAAAWAWRALSARHLISLIHPDNVRSMRVAERLGMSRRSEVTLRGQPALVFGLDAPEPET
jgi:RimJ/RimL family protein N-acetyltransferase